MLTFIAVLTLLAGFALLIALAIVDLRVRLLPNEMVLGFLTCGAVFHLTTLFKFMPPEQMALGCVVGFGAMYLIRAGANWYYKQDAMGLGDVKLLGAAGVWLGIEGVFLAITVGALAGVVHGVIAAIHDSKVTGLPLSFKGVTVPAGPGFCFGVAAALIWQFHELAPMF